MQIYSKNNL